MKSILKHLKHFFTPTERNNYKAKLLHHDFLFLILISFFGLTFLGNHRTNWVSEKILGVATDIRVEKLLDSTNHERIVNGLKPLTLSANLSQAAKNKAYDMFENNYWAHFSPTGKTPWDFILATGYKYESAGENLARDFMYSDEVVTGWINSQTHKENILNKDYTEIGFGVVNGILNGKDTTLVVQMFAKPTTSNIALNPTQSPKKVITTNNFNSKLIAENKNQEQKVLAIEQNIAEKINLKKITINYSHIIFGLLTLALVLDFYFGFKQNIARKTSKYLAHFVLFVFIMISIFIISQGVII